MSLTFDPIYLRSASLQKLTGLWTDSDGMTYDVFSAHYQISNNAWSLTAQVGKL